MKKEFIFWFIFIIFCDGRLCFVDFIFGRNIINWFKIRFISVCKDGFISLVNIICGYGI